MARIQAWTDQWARQLPHPSSGEVIIPDPQVSGHRLVLLKTRKVFDHFGPSGGVREYRRTRKADRSAHFDPYGYQRA